MELTRDSVEYRAGIPVRPAADGAAGREGGVTMSVIDHADDDAAPRTHEARRTHRHQRPGLGVDEDPQRPLDLLDAVRGRRHDDRAVGDRLRRLRGAVRQAQRQGPSASFDAASFSLTGGVLAQLAIAVLGVLVITSEYGSGMIRTTFAAVPQRLTVLGAKATVFAAVTLVVTTAVVLRRVLHRPGDPVGQGHRRRHRRTQRAAHRRRHEPLPHDPRAARARHRHAHPQDGRSHHRGGRHALRPAAVCQLPAVVAATRSRSSCRATPARRSSPAAPAQTDRMLSPWAGLGVFGLYAVVALIAAAFMLVRRDA